MFYVQCMGYCAGGIGLQVCSNGAVPSLQYMFVFAVFVTVQLVPSQAIASAAKLRGVQPLIGGGPSPAIANLGLIYRFPPYPPTPDMENMKIQMQFYFLLF